LALQLTECELATLAASQKLKRSKTCIAFISSSWPPKDSPNKKSVKFSTKSKLFWLPRNVAVFFGIGSWEIWKVLVIIGGTTNSQNNRKLYAIKKNDCKEALLSGHRK